MSIEDLYRIYLNTYITLSAEDRQLIPRQQSLKSAVAIALAAEAYIRNEGIISLSKIRDLTFSLDTLTLPTTPLPHNN
jgi:hypothetical protein